MNNLGKIRECIEQGDVRGLNKGVEELLQIMIAEEAMRNLAFMVSGQYSTIKADSTAKMMEVIIRNRPDLSMFNFPVNDFFKIAVLHGSPDLYECYIEEAILPFLKQNPEEEETRCYLDLYEFAYNFAEELFQKYVRCIKGTEFNSPFARYEQNENVLLINEEDYRILDVVVERYNSIIGRREILNDLSKRAGMEPNA